MEEDQGLGKELKGWNQEAEQVSVEDLVVSVCVAVELVYEHKDQQSELEGVVVTSRDYEVEDLRMDPVMKKSKVVDDHTGHKDLE